MSPAGFFPPVPRHLVPHDPADLPQVFTDVLVVGAGVAGCSAALEASKGARVLLLSKGPSGEGCTVYAQGGIAAAVGPGDDTGSHYRDTLEAGAHLCDPAVVREVVDAAPEAMARLQRMGVRFDLADGRVRLGREGGHERSRILHAGGDATGRELQRALLAAVAAEKSIRNRTGGFLVDLLDGERGVAGALFHFGPGDFRVVRARATILATGGACRVFRESTNPVASTGDGIAAAYRAGAELRDMEFVQFHPTVLYAAGAARFLVTEAVRGAGARLVDSRGDPVMEGVHPLGDLAPRDVVVRAILDRMFRLGATNVFLDMTHLPPEESRAHFPGVFRTCAAVGLDPSRDPIPVRPSAHYFIGGVRTDLDGNTGVEGLFACGEAAASGLHGANRLASNSLLEGLVLGARSGRAAALFASGRGDGPRAPAAGAGPGAPAENIDVQDALAALRSLTTRLVGPLRDGDGLVLAKESIGGWSSYLLPRSFPDPEGWELQNLLAIAGLMVDAAHRRTESRGTHHRRDFPERRDEPWRGRLVHGRGRETRFVPLEEVAR